MNLNKIPLIYLFIYFYIRISFILSPIKYESNLYFQVWPYIYKTNFYTDYVAEWDSDLGILTLLLSLTVDEEFKKIKQVAKSIENSKFGVLAIEKLFWK